MVGNGKVLLISHMKKFEGIYETAKVAVEQLNKNYLDIINQFREGIKTY